MLGEFSVGYISKPGLKGSGEAGWEGRLKPPNVKGQSTHRQKQVALGAAVCLVGGKGLGGTRLGSFQPDPEGACVPG